MKYPFSVAQMESEGHVYWVAKSSQLNGCVGQGDSVEEALAELAGNEEVWLETAADVGIPIPDVYVEKTQTYSGKLTLRVAPSVHERAALTCQKDPMQAWLTGQVLKYMWRWPLKNGKEDLRKARFYLDRLIDSAGND